MEYKELIFTIANILKDFDSQRPTHKNYQPGVGPFGEPQLIKTIATQLTNKGIVSEVKRTPDLKVDNEWAIEFKIVRPFGDNGKEAENWTVNMLHPYTGNVSLIGDAYKLMELTNYTKKGLFVIGYEHNPAIISLNPLIHSFEAIGKNVLGLPIGNRIEERRDNLIHPVHQVVRCIGWELINNS